MLTTSPKSGVTNANLTGELTVMLHNRIYTVVGLVFLILIASPSVANALTINGLLVQQTDCSPVNIAYNCSGTTLSTFTNIPSGSGTVYAQMMKDTYTKVKCINVKGSVSDRTSTVSLNAGTGSAQLKMSTQVFYSVGDGVSCSGLVTGINLSSPAITFVRDIP